MATAAELLDLDGVASRAEGVRFDITDTAGNVVSALHPITGGARIDNATGQQIKRRLSGIRIHPDEYADIDPIRHRIRPYWLLDVNGTVSEYPLGVFFVADAQTKRTSVGTYLELSCVDGGQILGQQIPTSIGFDGGTLVTTAITTVAEAAGFFTTSVDTSTVTLGNALAWPAGKGGVTYAKILDDLCLLGGFHAAYFDNDGLLTVRDATDLSTASAAYDFLDDGRIISGSVVESNTLLTAPNRFIVIDTTATTGNTSYIYDIAESAPHSYANRGFYVSRVVEAPGVGSTEQAAVVAETFYRQTPQAYETVVFASPPDPRLDTFDVINFRGVNYLEIEWSLVLTHGGPMTHKATRVYA